MMNHTRKTVKKRKKKKRLRRLFLLVFLLLLGESAPLATIFTPRRNRRQAKFIKPSIHRESRRRILK
ncbi:hypothetical protein BJQ97_03174 [Geobacillus sp. TFV-3]|nr:hypothetical protein BJQ97_03174 [Geobacillus sp. TFV-3]